MVDVMEFFLLHSLPHALLKWIEVVLSKVDPPGDHAEIGQLDGVSVDVVFVGTLSMIEFKDLFHVRQELLIYE